MDITIESFKEGRKILAFKSYSKKQPLLKQEKLMEQFKSAFLDDNVKALVDRLAKTPNDSELFQKAKQGLAEQIINSGKFSEEKQKKELEKLNGIRASKRLVEYMYSYILAAEGSKVI